MFVKWSKLTNSGKSILIGVMALSLGSMPGIHTHDVLIYALAYIAIAGIIWHYKEQHDITKIYYFISIPILSLAIYSPLLYYMLTGVGSSIHGISLVTSPTTITEYLGIYLLFIIIIVIYTLNTLKTHPWILLVPIVFAFFNYGAVGISLFCIFLLLKNRNMHFETIVAIIGFCVLIAMDIIYLNDFTGTRCNTVYKFVYIAWFLLGISSSVMAGRLLENHLSWLTKKRIWACIIVILVCLFIVPVQIGGNINHSNESLDGSDWIKHANRGDYEGIHYLRENANPKDIIVEAVSLGGYEGRISVMTGLSTVLGWAGNGHEGGWRIGTDYGDEVPSRIDDVKKIYENSSVTVKLMDKYGAKYLIVGDSELKMYNVSLPSEGIENVFSYENMTIIQRIK